MPASTVLLGFLAEQAAALVVKQARGVMSKMPWARDAQRVQSVERKIAVLVDRVATLARNVPQDSVDPLLEPMLGDFRNDLITLEKIPDGEANQIVESVRAQIRTEVLRPLQDAAQLIRRIETLESENDAQAKRLTDLEAFRDAQTARFEGLDRQSRSLQTLIAVALTLAFVATVVGLLVLARR